MGFFKDIKDLFDGISDANKELSRGVKEVFVETKRDIIADWKKEVPVLGNTVEKADRLITTVKNAAEHLPDPSPPPFNPNIKMKKIQKQLKKSKKVREADDIKRAMHVKVNRLGYSHHALTLNKHEVIHYQNGEVKIDSLDAFAKSGTIHVMSTPRLYKKEEVIARAYSKLGEKNYNLLFNNCEHFVNWAMNGDNL